MKISTILDHIDNGSMALPEFQRGYVWNRDQVRGLMDSLYRKHPVGSLLVWQTKTENADVKGNQELQPGTVKLLLDGQQRVTTLYGIIRGQAPEFFDGKESVFTDLYFHLDDEIFQFYGPVKMGGDPRWIDVTQLMREGIGPFLQKINKDPELQPKLNTYINRLNAIFSIQEIDLHIDEVTGADKTVDVVVDIFNKVNSGGTKLSKGDLALAKVCAEWPAAHDEMQDRLQKWEDAGFSFKLDWLLRNVNTVLTGEAMFTALEDITPEQFRQGLEDAEKYIDKLLNLIGGRLGLDHDRVLGSVYSFPLMSRYLAQRGGQLENVQESDRLLFWYANTMLWGRYAGSTESKLDQDLAAIEETEGALDRLVERLRQERGDLRLQSGDFTGWSRGARFYPMMYMLTRIGGATDWESGVELHKHMLGKHTNLHLHHIFPKACLYDDAYDYDRTQVNALANMTFLTAETNLQISDQRPIEYLGQFAAKNPGILESHWIPMDPHLWKVDNYLGFLAARQELLAEAANDVLKKLNGGTLPAPEEAPVEAEDPRGLAVVPGGVEDDEEFKVLVQLNDWVRQEGLPEGELLYELVDEDGGDPLALFDLAWPDGLQEGYSRPVALLIDEAKDTEEAANRAGFRFFTEADAFREYVRREILALEPELVAAD